MEREFEVEVLVTDERTLDTDIADAINDLFALCRTKGVTFKYGQTPKKDRHP